MADEQISEEKIAEEVAEIEEVIETGTHNGDGATKVFAETGLPVKTVEVQYAHYVKAKEYLKDFKNVEIFYASSLPYEKMIEFIVFKLLITNFSSSETLLFLSLILKSDNFGAILNFMQAKICISIIIL